MTRTLAISALCLGALFALGCDKKESPAPDTGATTKAAGGASPEAKQAAPIPTNQAPVAGASRFEVTKAKGSFLIDAPKEKIKGASEDGKGQLDVVLADLTKSRGEIDLRLTSLKTTTFDSAKDNDSQTEHALNWMEVGPDSPADKKAQFEWTKFTITQVETDTPKLADAKEANGARTVKAKVTGSLWLHGVTSTKTVPVTLTFRGPADAPTSVSWKSDAPMDVSMKEHQVMPRDHLGSFLAGALEKIGAKIDDKVQVSIEASAEKK